MKKLTIITAIILIMFLIMGCDKFNPDKYIGDWDFVTITEHYQTDSISGEWMLIGCDTVYYLGAITYYSFAGYDRYVKIQYTENNYQEVGIDKHGNINITCEKGASVKCGAFEGEDRVQFKLLCDNYPDRVYITGTKRKEADNE